MSEEVKTINEMLLAYSAKYNPTIFSPVYILKIIGIAIK
jgi:hypothetical protein